MASTATLSAVFPGDWAADMPKNLVDLMAADYDTLDDTAKTLRALAVDLVHSFEREPVLTAESALKLLERHHLPARPGKWTFVALSKDLERVYTRSTHGGMRLRHWVGNALPSPERLASSAPLPEGGGYLVVYGGGPSALDGKDAERAFSVLAEEFRMIDVILWDVQASQATFWSVRADSGQSGTAVEPFPNPETTRRWRDYIRSNNS